MKWSKVPPPVPLRPVDANKVTVGRVLVVGGSPPMAGAPALAGLGALRGGAGLVKIAVPQGIQATVAGFRPEATTLGLPQTRAGALGRAAMHVIRESVDGWDAVVLGPGLGRNPSTQQLVRSLVRSVDKPLVLDADALFAMIGALDEIAGRSAPTVLTPHEGEAGRLLALSTDELRQDREAAVAQLVESTGAVAVLKGPGTLVCDGEQIYVNGTGGPALATGGTGDVLAGLTGALLAGMAASGLQAFGCAAAAVHIHGAAADAVAGENDRGLLASELAAGIPAAFRELRDRGSR
ncbi:MAG: NAD(P)H-hydrate dehydratase [Planctomycetota bacterium]|nr:NAD(P)H-hydrate dehydratase [Planctomycetota bacterium]